MSQKRCTLPKRPGRAPNAEVRPCYTAVTPAVPSPLMAGDGDQSQLPMRGELKLVQELHPSPTRMRPSSSSSSSSSLTWKKLNVYLQTEPHDVFRPGPGCWNKPLENIISINSSSFPCVKYVAELQVYVCGKC